MEGTFTNACHAIRNGDGGQATATKEGIIVDASYAIRDGDGGQTCAERKYLRRYWSRCKFCYCKLQTLE